MGLGALMKACGKRSIPVVNFRPDHVFEFFLNIMPNGLSNYLNTYADGEKLVKLN